MEKYDLIDTADHAGRFRVFLEAVEVAGLKHTLKGTGPYTLLAPTDEAFVKVPQTKLHELCKSENRESLRSLLKKHIVAGNLTSDELKRHAELRAMNGEDLQIEAREGLWANEAQVITSDIQASNGVLHAIDTVLMPHTQAASAV